MSTTSTRPSAKAAQYLKIFTNRRIAVTFLLGFASGLPLPLTTGTLDAWMASEKVNLTTIGIFGLVGIPYTLKFLWAPFLDRYVPPFLNRRTGWIAVTQICLVGAIAFLGFSDPVHAPFNCAMVALIVAFLSASQDIVIDAYRADLLPEEEMGAGAAVSVAGARIALLTSGALALILSDRIPWSRVYLIMAGLMSVGLLTSIFSPAPRVDVKPPKSISDAVINPFVSYFKRSGALEMLLFIVLYKLGDAVAGKMTTPFLIQMGFSKTDIGTVNKGFGMIVTIIGALYGGVMVARLGILRSLWIFGILQGLSNLVFLSLATFGKNYYLMIACIGVENICGGMGTAAFVAFLMSLTDKHFTATQYALLSSLMVLARTFAVAPSGYLAQHLGWPMFFVMSACLAIPGLVVLNRVMKIQNAQS
jgi:MFS transporter, PAT family, beta-lactamase induction signal transducer AmpG